MKIMSEYKRKKSFSRWFFSFPVKDFMLDFLSNLRFFYPPVFAGLGTFFWEIPFLRVTNEHH